MSIIIIPYGDLCNKIMSLLGAIDLQKKTKKNIELWYTEQYEDIFYKENFKVILSNFPKLNFNNIKIKFFELDKSIDSYNFKMKHISFNKVENYIKKNFNDDMIIKFNIIANEFPLINYSEKQVIMNSYIRGYKNSNFSIIKNWLKDVTKYRSYDTFINSIGFNWINNNKNLCIIHLQIKEYYEGIFYNFNNYHFIHTIKYYEEALKTISKNSELPLYFIIMTDTNIDSLHSYYKKIEEYGEIIYINENLLNRTNITILASKAKYIIGSLNHYYSTFLVEIFDNIKLSIAPEFEFLDKNNYSEKVIFIDDRNFRINNKRQIIKSNLFLTENLSFEDKFFIYKSNYEITKKTFKSYYNKYDELIKSKYLKDLLLYKYYYFKEKKELIEVNSNISLNEGIEIFKIIKQYKPKKVVEIGFATGISTLFILCALDKNATLFSIDPYQKIQWNKFGLINVNNLLEELNLSKSMHNFIEDYSINFFNRTNELYDLVFIDGDHSYNGTMTDLIGSNKILKKNGLMIIDDVLHYDVKKALSNFLEKNNNYKKIDINLATMNFYIKR